MNKLKILALIPARMNSSRFPGKPLKEINGTSMVSHVYNNINNNKLLDLTAVATCDKVIFDHIEGNGGTAVMTSNKHERATDRCAEALEIIENKRKIKFDAVVMVQGDEPMVKSEMITESLTPIIRDKEIDVTNLLGKISSESEFYDTNCIKVVHTLNQRALYFSRQPIPTRSIIENAAIGKQVAIISFRRDFLMKYIGLAPTPLELAESVDMMRILEHGFSIYMVPTSHESFAVDTQEDLEKVKRYFKENS